MKKMVSKSISKKKFSFIIFYRFIKRNKQFVYQRDIPDTACLSEVCENAELMAKSFRTQKFGHPTNPQGIAEKFSCNSNLNKMHKNHLGKLSACQNHSIMRFWFAVIVTWIDASESSGDDEFEYISLRE